MVDVDNAHSQLIMIVDSGLGDVFQAQTLVSQFHNQVNRDVAAIWGHTAAEPGELGDSPLCPELIALALLTQTPLKSVT